MRKKWEMWYMCILPDVGIVLPMPHGLMHIFAVFAPIEIVSIAILPCNLNAHSILLYCTRELL